MIPLAITNLVDWMAELDVRPFLLLVGLALLVWANWRLQRRMKKIAEGMGGESHAGRSSYQGRGSRCGR
ncbi:hypothetical protein ACFL51_01990 [Myxococcota bacterium]